jgi:hypothetical protein
VAAAILLSVMPAHASSPPVGVYLWYPNPGVPTNSDCEQLVDQIQPSLKKAEDLVWGRLPQSPDDSLEFYLFVTQSRIESTWAAEGDFDHGAVRFEPTEGASTKFLLTPDDHPDVTIRGFITAPADSRTVSLNLEKIPLDDGSSRDRTTYYCRFTEEAKT